VGKLGGRPINNYNPVNGDFIETLMRPMERRSTDGL
jgi:hypothetical protein